MSRLPLEYLRHIRDELFYLSTTSLPLTEKDFSCDPTLQRAFVRSLEIIGEATKQLDKDFQEKYSNVPWSRMAQLRDKLIHHYFGIDYELM